MRVTARPLPWHIRARFVPRRAVHLMDVASDSFCPTLHIEHIDGHLHITRDRAGFDQFIARCTAS